MMVPDRDEKIYVWDMKTGNVVARTFVPKGLNADPQRVLCGAWTPVPGPQGYLLASAGDPDIHLWHLDPYK